MSAGVVLGVGLLREVALGLAAVAVEQLSVDPRALVGDKEPHQVGCVLRGTEPTGRLLSQAVGSNVVIHPTGVDSSRVDDVRRLRSPSSCAAAKTSDPGAPLVTPVERVPDRVVAGQGHSRTAVRTVRAREHVP